METVALAIAIIFFIIGLAGSILPILPGAVLIWAGMLVYGFLTKFNSLDTLFFIGQGLAVVFVYFIDYLAGIWGIKKYGGSRKAVYGSIIGLLLGLITLGPAGAILGPFIGAVAGEMLSKRQPSDAVRSGIGTLIGMLGGTIIKLLIQILMILWFFGAVYR